MNAMDRARALALAVPVLLLGGALGSQYLGGLHPCEMCYWQRWPHEAAIVLALLAILLRRTVAAAPMLALAAFAIFTSGAIGVFHAGVEYGWWQGITSCSAGIAGGSAEDILNSIMATPLTRCDQAQWSLGGVSMAGFNAIFSIGAAIAILLMMNKAKKA